MPLNTRFYLTVYLYAHNGTTNESMRGCHMVPALVLKQSNSFMNCNVKQICYISVSLQLCLAS